MSRGSSARGDIPGEPEHHERHEERGADQPAEEPMRPFPPIDGLELVDAHAVLELGIFWDLLIGGEGFLPVGLAQRRDSAQDRLPLGDRQARIGEPGGAADQNHRHDQRGEHAEPQSQRADVACGHGGVVAGSGNGRGRGHVRSDSGPAPRTQLRPPAPLPHHQARILVPATRCDRVMRISATSYFDMVFL